MPLFSGAIQGPQVDLGKHSIFKPVYKAEKLRKLAPNASKKHKKSTLESPINDFCENVFFANTSMRNPCFKSQARTENSALSTGFSSICRPRRSRQFRLSCPPSCPRRSRHRCPLSTHNADKRVRELLQKCGDLPPLCCPTDH